MRRLLAFALAVTCACTATPQSASKTQTPSETPTALRLAVAPPVLAPDGQLRFVVTPANEVQAEDVATGAVQWTLAARILAGAATTRWRLLPSPDGTSIYVQALSDESGLTYLGTRRIDTRTGVEKANDYKFESYWYEDIVSWTALGTAGDLLMAVERPAAAGGGYWVRTLDPLTLKMRADVRQPGPPAIPGR
jgi:hypothetical protein